MARKKMIRKSRNGIKPMVKKTANLGASLLMLSPVIYPAIKGVQKGIETGKPTVAFDWFVYEATGFSIDHNRLDKNKLTEVAARDAVMIGGGKVLKWGIKRA